ncbi:MAG TPA: copper amine oxidase N-terminal domain-containing protein [Candidatus Eremiobacteraceae bacterium]|nr:copper amine oxidase N-terminal domain-containing protein [Candidatus Eremiobacteraceae bacterium]
MIALVAALIVAGAPARVAIDGTMLSAASVSQVGGRTFVALRAAAAAFNADLAYDPRSKTATFTTVVRQVELRVGQRSLVVNGVRTMLDVAPIFVGDRMLVPLRALALGFGATVHANVRAHEIVVTSGEAGASPPGQAVVRSSSSLQTLQGTVTKVDTASGAADVYIDSHGQQYRVVIPAGDVIQFRETRGNMAGAGTIAQVRAGDTLIVSSDAAGSINSVADIFTSYLGTIAAIAGSSMVLTSGRVVNADPTDTVVSLDGRPATFADLHVSDAVTVRADPLTGKVRDVVAASMAASNGKSSPAASGGPSISSTQDNAAEPLRAGQSLRVTATGSAGAAASFDIGDMIVGMPMREIRPGRYEGSFDIGAGTNLVAAPLIVRFSLANASAQALAPDTATIITTPPTVREIAPAAGAVVSSLRPSIYVTFNTVGARGMLADSERLLVNGVDVTAASTRNASYIYYLPGADLTSGTIRVELRASDTAGNPLTYSWSFELTPP